MIRFTGKNKFGHKKIATKYRKHTKYNKIFLQVSKFSTESNKIYFYDVSTAEEKENWRILTNEEIYANIKKPTITEKIRLHRLRWFGHVQRMEENRIPKRVLYMNLETTRPRGRPRNRWLDEVREDGRRSAERSGRKKCRTGRNGRGS